MISSLKRVSFLLTIVIFAVFVVGCGPLSNDLDLKRAFVRLNHSASYEANYSLSFSVDANRLDRNVQANRIFFEYAENSTVSVNHKFLSHGPQRQEGTRGLEGLTHTTVDLRFFPGGNPPPEQDIRYTFNFYSQFRYGDLTQETNRLFITQAYSFTTLPQHVLAFMPENSVSGGVNAPRFTLHLDDQEFIKDYLARLQASTAPNWNQMLPNLAWTRLNSKHYRASLTDEIIKDNFDLVIANTMLESDDNLRETWEADWLHRWEEAKNAFTFTRTVVDATIDDTTGNLTSLIFTSAVDFDLFTFNNRVMGRPYGRDITIPLIVELAIEFKDINNVETFFFPMLGVNDMDFEQYVPWKRAIPDFKPVPPMYTDGRIRVFLEDQNGDTTHALSGGERTFNEIRFQGSLPPIIYNDRILLPMKYMMEAYGGSITDHGGGRVSTVLDMRSVVVQKDSNIASIRGREFRLPAPVGIANDAFYAPVMLFDEAFDVQSITEIEQMEDGTNMFSIYFVKH